MRSPFFDKMPTFRRSNSVLRRKSWLVVVLVALILMSACAARQNSNPQSLLNNDIRAAEDHNPPGMMVPEHKATATTQPQHSPTKVAHTNAPKVSRQQNNATTITTSTAKTTTAATAGQLTVTMPMSAKVPAPYGLPSGMTPAEIQLSQQLFVLINSDRAMRGLYPYGWDATLAGGARLHSWNMFHCGFSHTCPDGVDQCQRIANEGFAGFSDCGENIAYAGPFPTAWAGVQKIQEGMVNEPPTGWHRIHLFSQTLHRVGVGVFVDPKGYIWFTEDMVS